jgi:hypothetical protein
MFFKQNCGKNYQDDLFCSSFFLLKLMQLLSFVQNWENLFAPTLLCLQLEVCEGWRYKDSGIQIFPQNVTMLLSCVVYLNNQGDT